MYTTGEFAEKVCVHPHTVQEWDRDGKVVAHRTQTGRRYYTESLSPEQEIVRCFSSRLYGLRNYRKTLKGALKHD